VLSPIPDQGGAKIRESILSPKTGKSFTNHQYVAISSRENCPLLLSISPIPRRKPTTILIGRKIIRPKVHLFESETGDDKRKQDIKNHTSHVKPIVASRLAMRARIQSWIISEKRR
jgi:hypothetical protein